MGAVIDHQVIKSIQSGGEISLGKKHAGRQVLVETPEPDVWVIRTTTVIPDNQKWMARNAKPEPLVELDLKSPCFQSAWGKPELTEQEKTFATFEKITQLT